MPDDAASVPLRPLRRSDADAVRRLWSRRFGGESSTQTNWIEAALAPSHSAAGFVAVPAPSDQIVGVSFLDVGSRTYAREYLGLATLDVRLPLAEQNGIFHLTCVRRDWEGRGLGSAFYERRLALLADRDVPYAAGIAWHRPEPPDSRVLFEKHEFTRHATVERYYARTGTRPNCPLCSEECTCTASLYGRPLGDA
ncbi:MAG: hypothetical protein ABEK84_02695 [Salinibacter sp.]